jgi:phosphoglycerol transferase MdoB-like AlkP superfamily enzyme
MYLLASNSRLIKRFLFLLIPFTLLRLGFYFYHLDIYNFFSPLEILTSFLLGLRFDLAAILLLNSPVILISLIPSKNSRLLFLERSLFAFLNTVAFLLCLVDYELFLFIGKRFSFDLFMITDDIWDQLPQLILNFWYFPLFGAFLGIIFFFLDKRFFNSKEVILPLPLKLISIVVVLTLSFVGIRGGLQHKSINVQSAFLQGKNELGHLVLNSPYHFLRTLKNKSQVKLKYFAKDDEAVRTIVQRQKLLSHPWKANNKNIIIIVLESFSLEYMEKGYTPFLAKLKNKSLFFSHHLANGRRSIEALPSLLCGLPSLLDEPLSKSIFQSNKFSCMPKILKGNGYTNYFFHGGSKGTMGFESYTLSNGFDRYFSRDDYDTSSDYDGTWGIYDAPYLRFAADQISKLPQPFMAGIFTLSSHQPYSVPTSQKGKFPKGSLEIHESIGYADNALELFFERIKSELWFKNTVFFITSDHTSKLETVKFQNMIGRYRVPFLIYSPGESSVSVSEKVTQHSDIPKMMLNSVGIAGRELPATSLGYIESDAGFAINYADGRDYFLVSENEVTTLTKDNAQNKYSYDWNTGDLKLIGESHDPLLKSYLQYFVNGLINNNLSINR